MSNSAEEQMTTKQRIVFWFVFFVAVFALAYTATDLTVKYVMADFQVKNTGYTSLEVKENTGTQTDNQYKVQPAKNVQEQ